MCEAIDIATVTGIFCVTVVGLNVIRKLQDNINLKQEILAELKKLNSKMSYDIKKDSLKQSDIHDELKKKRDISRLRP